MEPIALTGGLRDVTVRLVAAVLVGAVIGLNRELREKPAGLRTHALVSLGSALVTLASLQIASAVGVLDASAALRGVQGVITGIGFLGGGLILRDDSKHMVYGLTTAASAWVAAGLGIACGAGQWPTATIATALTLVVLMGGRPIERVIHRRLRGRTDEDNGEYGAASREDAADANRRPRG